MFPGSAFSALLLATDRRMIDPNCEDVFDVKYRLRKYLEQVFAREIDLANYKYLKPYAKSEIDKELCIVQ